jgi:hypothetical protein
MPSGLHPDRGDWSFLDTERPRTRRARIVSRKGPFAYPPRLELRNAKSCTPSHKRVDSDVLREETRLASQIACHPTSGPSESLLPELDRRADLLKNPAKTAKLP